MNQTLLIGLILIGVGMSLMWLGVYGWSNSPELKFPTIENTDTAPPSGGGGGGFG